MAISYWPKYFEFELLNGPGNPDHVYYRCQDKAQWWKLGELEYQKVYKHTVLPKLECYTGKIDMPDHKLKELNYEYLTNILFEMVLYSYGEIIDLMNSGGDFTTSVPGLTELVAVFDHRVDIKRLRI
jgi:hypothetical protein